MRFVRIEEIFHRISYLRSHVLEPRMLDPVLGSVFRKRNVPNIFLVNVIIQTEKNTQASLGEDCVCRLKNDVIPGDIRT